LKKGKSFSEALQQQPKHFPADLVRTVKAGEQTGFLDLVLADHAIYEKQRQLLLGKFQQALFYPCIVLLMGSVLLVYVLVFIIPSFQNIFTSLDIRLSVLLKAMFLISTFVREQWALLIGAILAIFASVVFWLRSDQGKELMAKLFWHSRIGKLFWLNKSFWLLSRFLGAGIPLLEAMKLARGVISNSVFRQKWSRLSQLAEKGQSLHQAAIYCGLPEDAIVLLKSREQAGRLGEGLQKIAEMYQLELNERLGKINSLVEPAAILLVGGVVGAIVCILFLPLLQMTREMM
jgi:type IV pilus assembly protein PilC